MSFPCSSKMKKKVNEFDHSCDMGFCYVKCMWPVKSFTFDSGLK